MRSRMEKMTMKRMQITLSSAIALLLAGPVVAGGSGSELFENLGCINCHGADGRNPISKVVPELAGKPKNELFEKATKILAGEGGTKESKLMHAAFYSPSQCDNPPTDEEVRAITGWLSQL